MKKIHFKSKIISLILSLSLFITVLPFFTSCACAKENIYILFTNDVHGGEDYITYSGLKDYKKQVEKVAQQVTLVDVGDAISGTYLANSTKGEYIVELMNMVGYDYMTLGNHEFEYGLERLNEIIDEQDGKYLACNISYSGNKDNALDGVLPYAIEDYGDIQVGFIGVSTPYTITSSTPTYFMENGEFVYNFASKNNGQDLYDCVQRNVDECTSAGADLIILLSHLGDDVIEYSPYSVIDVINNTVGIDIVLDAHAHNVIKDTSVANKSGENVVISSTGTGLENIGQIVINNNGDFIISQISGYSGRDESVTEFIEENNAQMTANMSKKIISSQVDLTIYDEYDVRMVRNRETNLGNLCADAYKFVSGADIGFINGGGVRADIKKGDITLMDLMKVHPYSNVLCMVEATGAQILDALEYSCMLVQSEYSSGGKAVGEFGGFLSVSGLRFTVDTSIDSSVVVSEDGMFVEVAGERRVKNVLVKDDNGYSDLDLHKIYKVASINYTILDCGDGYTMFKDCNILIGEGIYDYDVLTQYLQSLSENDIAQKYSTIDGRINVT